MIAWEMHRAHQSLRGREPGLVVEPTSLLVLADKHSVNGRIAFSSLPFRGEEQLDMETLQGISTGCFPVGRVSCSSVAPSTARGGSAEFGRLHCV